MNKIFLIGNGFDLAHGLKTSYSDFMLWYINSIIKRHNTLQEYEYEDDLISFNTNGSYSEEFISLAAIKEALSKGQIHYKCKNLLFARILGYSTDSKWVDIEYEYFCQVLNLYRQIEKHQYSKLEGETKIKDLNFCFESIKNQLVNYLNTINTETYESSIEQRFKDELRKRPYNEVLFLNFNYTNTIEQYLRSLNIPKCKILNIHGQLNKADNPIIFGYGDEMTDYYNKIESLNINEFLNYFKSFKYLQTINYQYLDQFLKKDQFHVSIMGHSCGISDRVLLNSIFCHQNCIKIQIFYYKKKNGDNDYFEKTQEISRHFTLENRNIMRNLIIPFPDSCSLS